MKWRTAQPSDSAVLAQLNAALIRDEGHSNPMTLEQLTDRMRGWLESGYSALLFETDDQVIAYALYRDNEGRGIYLRQFFVVSEVRRRGLGRKAFELLRNDVLGPNTRIAVEVLSGNERALSFWKAVGFTDYARTLEIST